MGASYDLDQIIGGPNGPTEKGRQEEQEVWACLAQTQNGTLQELAAKVFEQAQESKAFKWRCCGEGICHPPPMSREAL
jgi:hypothetical protein